MKKHVFSQQVIIVYIDSSHDIITLRNDGKVIHVAYH